MNGGYKDTRVCPRRDSKQELENSIEIEDITIREMVQKLKIVQYESSQYQTLRTACRCDMAQYATLKVHVIFQE